MPCHGSPIIKPIVVRDLLAVTFSNCNQIFEVHSGDSVVVHKEDILEAEVFVVVSPKFQVSEQVVEQDLVEMIVVVVGSSNGPTCPVGPTPRLPALEVFRSTLQRRCH